MTMSRTRNGQVGGSIGSRLLDGDNEVRRRFVKEERYGVRSVGFAGGDATGGVFEQGGGAGRVVDGSFWVYRSAAGGGWENVTLLEVTGISAPGSQPARLAREGGGLERGTNFALFIRTELQRR